MTLETAPDEAFVSPPDDTSNTAEETVSVARATGLIALGNITSRVLGLVREMLLSYLFGAGATVDAFKTAIIVPRSIYDLLIGGHVNSALVPVLGEYASRESREDLWELINRLLGLVIILLLMLILALQLFAPQIVRIFVDSDEASAETVSLATDLLRITSPALLFLSLFAILSGLLYALKRFRWPAFAASVFNGTIVFFTIAFAGEFGITAVAVGWLAGAIVQLLVQLPDLRDAKLWPRFRDVLTHPGVRAVGVLYVPVLFTLGLDVLINRPFSYNLASGTGESNISYMEWATTLIQFPHGLVATAISLAVLPTLAQQATRGINDGLNAFKDTLGFGLRLAVVLIVPATFGLFVLASPVIALIFEHGQFTATDTDATALALQLYLLGLPFAAIDLILVFAFYAQQDTVTPAIIGFVSLLAYMATALLLLPHVGFYSLMIADSVKHVVHTSISGLLLARRIDGLRGQQLMTTASRTLLAAGLMAGCVYVALLIIERVFGAGFIGELVAVAMPGVVGVIVFVIVANLSGIQEIRWLLQFVRQRVRRAA